MKNKSIIVAGGGASGMAAAIEAAKRGIDVTVLEAESKVCKKIYSTGNGRCNLTNTKMSEKYYRSQSMDFVKKITDSFGYEKTLSFFKELGLLFKDKDGYIYPLSMQASSVAEALYIESQLYGIKIICDSPVRAIEKANGAFKVKTDDKVYRADGVILACGSMAGINREKQLKINGYDLAKSMGHTIVPIVSALTGIKCKNKEFYKMARGVRCDGKIELLMEENGTYNKEAADFGELQLTEYGVSGIPAFQVSRYASYGVRDKRNVKVKIDFLCNMTQNDIIGMIHEKCGKNKALTLLQLFTGVLNDKLAAALIRHAGLDERGAAFCTDEASIKKIVLAIKEYTDIVTGTNDFSSSQVLAGGISLDELQDTMESKIVRDLYMTGEMLDADGMCGGYNLQWAWATGATAGRHILERHS